MSAASDAVPRRPPVARWLSIDEFRLVAQRNSEKNALEFCEDLLNSGSLAHASNHAATLRGCKCRIHTTRIAIGGYSVLFHLLFDSTNESWLLRIRLPRCGQSGAAGYQMAETLRIESEIATMAYVRARSTIPVPTVCGY
jgi:hypothetical protein